MATAARRFRVVSFNIQHGLRSDATGVDVDLTASIAAGLQPDVLALQEVDVLTPRSHLIDEAKRVNEACGLDHRFAFAAVVGGVGRYGNALGARGTLHDVEVRRLPRRRFRSEPRSIALARAALDPLDGRSVTIGATHLSIHREEVFDQLRASVAWLTARPGPWIYVGDLNLFDDDIRSTIEAAGLTLADTTLPTFPVSAPRARIDHVAVGGGLRIVAVTTAPTTASDHLPLVVDLELDLSDDDDGSS